MKFTLLLAILALPIASRSGQAQRYPPPVVARDSGAVMHRIAEGVFAILHDDPVHSYPDGSIAWPHGNTGVVVGDREVLVIDSDFYPSRATADIALIRTVTDKPVRYLVNTHTDPDHVSGNAVYQRVFPGLEIVGARPNTSMALSQERFPRRILSLNSAARRTLAGHEQLLARGRDSTGKPLAAAEQALLARVVEQERTWLRESATIEVAIPTVLFDLSHRIDLGGRVVELRNRGAGHSAADVTVWLPKEQVLFTGDLLAYPVPYVYGIAYIRPWTETLRAFEATPLAAIVPGHGPIFADAAYVSLVKRLFQTATGRMDSLVRAGRTPAEARDSVDLSDFRSRFLAPDSPNGLVWDVSIRTGLPQSIYQCLIGTRC